MPEIRIPVKKKNTFGKYVAPVSTIAGAAVGAAAAGPGGMLAGASLGASLGGGAGAVAGGIANKDVGQAAEGVAQGTGGAASAMDRRLQAIKTPEPAQTDTIIDGLEAVPYLPQDERSYATKTLFETLQEARKRGY